MPTKPKTHRPRGYKGPKVTKREYDKKRGKSKPWRKWYFTARWKKLRALVLNEDPYCVRCADFGIVTPATIANHIKKHDGDPALFWDRNNIEGVCKPCHDGVIQSEERRKR